MQVARRNVLLFLRALYKPGHRPQFRNGYADNPLTARAIAEQAGLDGYVAQATPQVKLDYIRQEQAKGKLVAMVGDGTNDAPALAQADVGPPCIPPGG